MPLPEGVRVVPSGRRGSGFFETVEAEGARDPRLLLHLREVLRKFGAPGSRVHRRTEALKVGTSCMEHVWGAGGAAATTTCVVHIHALALTLKPRTCTGSEHSQSCALLKLAAVHVALLADGLRQRSGFRE